MTYALRTLSGASAELGKPDGELLHVTNWIDCVRSRKEPTAPVAAGVAAAAAAHLSNQAMRTGQTAVWKA